MEQPPEPELEPEMWNFRSTDLFDFRELFYHYAWDVDQQGIPARGIDFLTTTFADLSVGDCGYALNQLKNEDVQGFQAVWANALSAPHELVDVLYNNLRERQQYSTHLKVFEICYEVICIWGRRGRFTVTVSDVLLALGITEDDVEDILDMADVRVGLCASGAFLGTAARVHEPYRAILWRLLWDEWDFRLPVSIRLVDWALRAYDVAARQGRPNTDVIDFLSATL